MPGVSEGEVMSVKEQIIQALDGLSEIELVQMAEFMAFLKFRARFDTVLKLDEAQLTTLYAEFAEEDRELAEEGIEVNCVAIAPNRQANRLEWK
jgi:hypothetical protein